MERFGLQKGTISTDEDITVEMGLGEDTTNIARDMVVDESEFAAEQKQFFDSCKSISYEEWNHQQNEDNRRADEMLRNDPRTRKAWYEHNHLHDDGESSGIYTIPNNVFDSYYVDAPKKSQLQEDFDSITNIR